jgi:hypothetical protein
MDSAPRPEIAAGGLSRRAVLVRLAVSCWSGQVRSARAAALAEEAAQAARGTVRAVKRLLPNCDSLAAAQSLERLIARRANHKFLYINEI